MSIFKKLTTLFQGNLLAFISTAPPEEDPQKEISEMYFRGAWQEDGVAKWAFFKARDNNETSAAEIEKCVDDKTEYTTNDLGKSPIEPEDLYEAEGIALTEDETDGQEPSHKEIISITDLGRNLNSRYQPVIKEEEVILKSIVPDILPVSVPNTAVEGLVDQRDIIGEASKIKVFFAEDTKSFQIILKTLIGKNHDMELVGWAPDGIEALDKIRSMASPPDVILMDVAMPRMDGISTTKELLNLNSSMKIVMLTAYGDRAHVVGAFEAGAIGFLRKDAGLTLIIEAIKQAARGGRPVHKEVSMFLEYKKNDGKVTKEEGNTPLREKFDENKLSDITGVQRDTDRIEEEKKKLADGFVEELACKIF
jgi:DNA-binding NarL/FixJ family response regulator